MCTKSLILSSSGLKNLVSGSEHEFKFAFNQQTISMKNIYAEFICPKVSKFHQIDPTIDCIFFNEELKDITLSENTILKIGLLSKGETITISEEESFEMKVISILLDNEELFNKLSELYPSEINETNIDHYLSKLTFFSQISPFNLFNYENIIDKISSYFYLIDKEKLKTAPKPILYSIINNSNLRLDSEDSLLDFLNEVFTNEENSEKIKFYEEIEFSMLSEYKFEEFINDFDSSTMTHYLWLRLKECFYTNKNDCINKVNENRYQTKYSVNIIEHLTNEVEGNVVDKEIVNVSASSIFDNNYARNAVNIHNINSYFYSQNIPNSWLKYDFIKRKVHPTGYLITTQNTKDSLHPRNWVIEGSNNDIDWVILDTREKDKSLKGLNVTVKFNIKPQKGSYRYLRIRQTGKNSSNSDFFGFQSLEFIGTLF